ncbi:hypothetical protein [Streptomyces hiroshimensis]|uniref:Uncharacterized protein n=1 Tax=Streptomyces hiroshimensis TaxID=66424 RepID=A0ABQ2Y9Z8_9ACTN|nr:hypothetical protein [Streptomyces hiroshimensis]GGX77555.1 hypothetical protein GCM10010324_23850 [Streptomyces hiroshimensis]
MTRKPGAALWTGYRAGALVVDRDTGRMGVMQARTEDGYPIAPVDGSGGRWTARSMDRLRIATNEERKALGLSPRRVD